MTPGEPDRGDLDVPAGVTARPIVVIGAPGAGKSTVGRRLARHWGVDFHDTDQLIEESVGKSVSDIFVEEGESAFRAREREIVARALVEFDGVVALGGGAVIDEQTRQRLAQAPCLWLRVGASEAARRVGLNTSRPLLLGNVRGTLMTLLDERTPMYEEVATWTIDTDGRSADEVVEAVLAALEVA